MNSKARPCGVKQGRTAPSVFFCMHILYKHTHTHYLNAPLLLSLSDICNWSTKSKMKCVATLFWKSSSLMFTITSSFSVCLSIKFPLLISSFLSVCNLSTLRVLKTSVAFLVPQAFLCGRSDLRDSSRNIKAATNPKCMFARHASNAGPARGERGASTY